MPTDRLPASRASATDSSKTGALRAGAPGTSKPKSRALRTRVWSAGGIVLLGVALLVTFGAFFLTGMRVANRAREVKVPSLQGLSMADANRALAEVGLGLKVEMRRADPKVPADHVLAQDPPPGTVLRRQRPVRVRISDGQRDPAVPSVVGMVERTAEVVLAQEKIEIGDRAEIRSRAMETGAVVSQDPPAKASAAKVSLLVNRGEEAAAYVMPDVIGALSARVVDILRRHGFRVTVAAEVPYPGIAPGIVVRQSPQAGFRIGYGEAVQLEISR
jgi:beta-lactam-binding protein with PASTA domain